MNSGTLIYDAMQERGSTMKIEVNTHRKNMIRFAAEHSEVVVMSRPTSVRPARSRSSARFIRTVI